MFKNFDDTKKHIFICFTVFHLYTVLLLINYTRLKNTILIITPNLKEFHQALVKLMPNLSILYIDDLSIELEFKKTLKKKVIVFSLNKLLVNICESKYPVLEDKADYFSNSIINVFLGAKSIERYFFIKYPQNYIRLIEDGYQTYLKTRLTITKKIISTIYNFPVHLIKTKLLNEIMVQRPEDLKNNFLCKKTSLNFNSLHENVSEEIKILFIEIFLTNQHISSSQFDKILHDSSIIFTQPLSEDGLIDEAHKIKIYRKLIEEFTSKKEKIILKPHPREITNYAELNMGRSIYVLAGNFPIELLNLILRNKKIKKGITLFSSAVDNLDFIENKINVGIDYDRAFASIYKKKRNVVK